MKNNLIFFKWRNSYFFGAVFFSGQLIFGSSYFFRTVTSSQQLLFQNSYFFRGKLVLNSYFLRIDCSLGRLLLQNSCFFGRLIQSKDIQKSFLSEASNLSEQLLIQQSYFFKKSYFFRIAAFLEELLLKTVNFSGKHNSAAATFSGQLRFQGGYFSKRATCL